MKNNTTPSSSTASNTTPHQSQDSTEPLDVASCSASSICDVGVIVDDDGIITHARKEQQYWVGMLYDDAIEHLVHKTRELAFEVKGYSDIPPRRLSSANSA
jgi:hypothetical protein